MLGRPIVPTDAGIGAVFDLEIVREWLDSSAVVGEGAFPC